MKNRSIIEHNLYLRLICKNTVSNKESSTIYSLTSGKRLTWFEKGLLVDHDKFNINKNVIDIICNLYHNENNEILRKGLWIGFQQKLA